MDYLSRRRRLIERLNDLGVDAMLITHLPNVRYLTGYSGSNGQALISAGDSRFFTDGRYIEQSRREVPDMERVIYSAEFPNVLADGVKDLRIARIGFEASSVTYKSWQDWSGIGELVPLGDEVGRMRWIKDSEELELIRRAQSITDSAFEEILTFLREGASEKEVAFELRALMETAGAERLAFETIAAFGENAAEPHHEPTDRRLRANEMVKLDFGAVAGGYHSDMTRTVSLGEPQDEMRKIYDIVRESQQAGIEAAKAGAIGREVDAASRSVIKAAGYGESFSHGLGHGVGLEIHEGPTLRKTGEDILPAGTVVTVEPGIYVAGLGGVRIEDMVEVTETGCRPMPKSTKELVIL